MIRAEAVLTALREIMDAARAKDSEALQMLTRFWVPVCAQLSKSNYVLMLQLCVSSSLPPPCHSAGAVGNVFRKTGHK